MTEINPKHLIDELRYNVKRQDKIKANIVLSYFFDVDKNTQKELVRILEQGPAEFSIPLIVDLIQKKSSLINELPEIKNALIAKALEAPELLLKIIENDAIQPKELFIRISGEIRLEQALPVLIKILVNTKDESILKETITALGLIGDPKATNAVSEFLYSNNKALTIAAIKTLGQIGTPTAMQRLAEKLGQDPQLDVLILDIFSQVQDNISLQKLNETLGSHYAHLRNYAKSKLVQIGAKAVPLLIQNLVYDDPDLLIHTLNVLGEIGDPSTIVPIRKLLHNHPDDPNVRFAAYEALGMLPIDKGAYVLASGLTDEEEHVRVAAASAIDRSLNEILVAGIKNMVRHKDEDTIKIIRSIINAQASNIFISLIEEPVFQELVINFLQKKATPDVRAYFQKLLEKHGYKDLAQKLSKEVATHKAKIRALAVDDSKMILNIYKSTLYELGCDPILFDKPADALEWLKNNKPQIMFTDLNMPEITGIDLIAKTRSIYRKSDLPIIMVTTQNEVQDNEAAYAAGVNEILFKPFTSETIKQVLDKFVTSGS